MKSITGFLFAVAGYMAMSAIAAADNVTQVTNGPGDTTTMIQTPTGTTTITTTPGKSIVTKTKDGNKIEIDSDNSVYTVFPDGARVAATNGMHTLSDGSVITVKDGKRIP
ncbi:MAG TPA: hypothetical protein VFT64_11800 [Rickettsiales bacterium]|nr:hypothetical protein [Rickettsiales bacterium]